MELKLNLKENFDIFLNNMWKRKWLICLYGIALCVFMLGSYQEGIKDGIINISRFNILALIFVIGVICISTFTNLKKIHNIAFLIVLLFGILNAIITPILDSPDELVHFYRSELTSRGDFFPIPDNEGYITIQSGEDINYDIGKTVLNAECTNDRINYEKIKVKNVAAGNFVLGYFPQAIGINIAKTLNLSAIWLVWMGRIINAVFAAFLTKASLKMVSNFKIPLFVMACFPLAVYQAGSLSIDATVNYFSLLSIAFFIRLYEKGDGAIERKQVFLFFLLCLIPGFSKITYMSLSCLVFFLPMQKFKKQRFYYETILGIFIMLLLSIGWYYYTTKIPLVPTQQSYSEINNVNVTQQVKMVLDNLFGTFIMLVREIVYKFGNFSVQFFTFGWLSYGSQFLMGIYLMFYGALSFMYPLGYNLTKKTKLGLGIVCISVYIATELIMYLSWTTVGANSVEGVQSRYFLPLLAVIPMIFNFNCTKKENVIIDLYCLVFVVFFLGASVLLTALTYY